MSLEWVKGTLSKSVQGLDRFDLFLDDLKSQEYDEFKSAVVALNSVTWFGLENATDLWQAVDAQMLKVLIGQGYRNWLDKEGKADR